MLLYKLYQIYQINISKKFWKLEYIYGEAANDESLGTINSIGLFNGSNVKTLKFNKNLVMI